MSVRPFAAAGLVAVAMSLGACQDSGMLGGVSARSLAPIPAQTLALMQTKSMSQSDPILIRAYKKEAEMEVWKRNSSGQYALLKTFPICRWSGQLGPKMKEGDRQAPEGFYTIAPGQMNPNSAYYLSFDVGYPNAVDRAKGGTGKYIMVHGTCSSAGCFAMTDASMAEVYAIARDAFQGGQRAFQFQSYPFRMTAQNMAKFRNDPNAPFWRNLKEGSDYFEALKEEPRTAACGTKYVFGGSDVAAGSCTPRVDPLVAEKRETDNRQIAELVAKGEKATRVLYADGSGNAVFRPQAPQSAFASLTDGDKEKELAYSAKEYSRHNLGDVSRPESLVAGPQEIEIDAKGRPVLVAAAAPNAPGPTKLAAAALTKKNAKGKGGPAASGPTLLAAQEPAPEAKPAAPARIAVADADGDPGAYQKLLGNLFGKSEAAPAAPTPVAEAAPAAQPEAKPASATPSTRIAARHAARASEVTETAATSKKTEAPKRHADAAAKTEKLRDKN
ncbi:murein L,D-transpeptidase [Methylobacterium sp. C25]|uniref:L,D-transpeptidase family protein n=1 Tax=Methylobacterium sp. C25 TaxID=2721622 RepID=UPI001F33B436|nr:murein L,D-transpeptidase family protein [Methylobacterium sp. C25]MCE4224428.1 murein L,D-transpeptidase [Methylobacterium sp. C25]